MHTQWTHKLAMNRKKKAEENSGTLARVCRVLAQLNSFLYKAVHLEMATLSHARDLFSYLTTELHLGFTGVWVRALDPR